MFIEAGAGGVELTDRGGDRALRGEQMRETAASHARAARQAVSIRGADGGLDRGLGAGVAELRPREAERVQRGNLGLARVLGLGELQRSLGQPCCFGGVHLDPVERRLGKCQWIEIICND